MRRPAGFRARQASPARVRSRDALFGIERTACNETTYLIWARTVFRFVSSKNQQNKRRGTGARQRAGTPDRNPQE
jgi:hypothetical protein